MPNDYNTWISVEMKWLILPYVLIVQHIWDCNVIYFFLRRDATEKELGKNTSNSFKLNTKFRQIEDPVTLNLSGDFIPIKIPEP